MNKKMYIIFPFFLFASFSCDKVINTQFEKYSLNISEIDYNTNETVVSYKNTFISHKKGLFEYDFGFKTKSTISENFKSGKTSYDSVSLSFIPQDVPLYYQFNFEGKLLKKDSVKKKSNDFIKIDASNKTKDPLYDVIKNLSEKDLTDTFFNNLKLKSYKYPQIIKDSIGDMTLQLFFSIDTLLKTPFNVNNRYHKPFNKYNLVGLFFTIAHAKRKMIMMISDIREATKAEISLCNNILKKIPNSK